MALDCVYSWSWDHSVFLRPPTSRQSPACIASRCPAILEKAPTGRNKQGRSDRSSNFGKVAIHRFHNQLGGVDAKQRLNDYGNLRWTLPIVPLPGR